MRQYFECKLRELAYRDPNVNAALSAMYYGKAAPEEILVGLIKQLAEQKQELTKRLIALHRTLPVQPVIFPSYPKE